MSQSTTPRRDTKTAIVGVPMTENMRSNVEALAVEKQWSLAQAARYLIGRGLEAEASETEVSAA